MPDRKMTYAEWAAAETARMEAQMRAPMTTPHFHEGIAAGNPMTPPTPDPLAALEAALGPKIRPGDIRYHGEFTDGWNDCRDAALRFLAALALPHLDLSYGKTPTYEVPGGCLTCGQRFVVRRGKGVKPPLSVVCPSCGCAEYGWLALTAPTPTSPPSEALREALFDEYGINVVDEALGVAINSTAEMQVNRDRWEAARRALRAALTPHPEPEACDPLDNGNLLTEDPPDDARARERDHA
jgi:hypothetical protein